MSNLTMCPQCRNALVSYKELHALNGELFCSRECAINYTLNEIIMNAKEAAIEDYACNAEVVSMEDVLKEDLQGVEIKVTCKRVIWLPKTLTEQDAIDAARNMYRFGNVEVNPAECDESTVKYELVKEDNSSDSGEG